MPDDHFTLVKTDLEIRRTGALRGGLTEKAAEYARQQQRLTKLGRTFAEVDNAVGSAAEHYSRISKAIRAGGKVASLVGIALAILDGGIAVYEVAKGKAEVDELAIKLSKSVVGGAAAWGVGEAAAGVAASAGAVGAAPIAVAIVVSTATYLVIDWGIGKIANSLKVARLTVNDVKRIWPNGVRGIPLDRLYNKPEDAAVLSGKPEPTKG